MPTKNHSNATHVQPVTPKSVYSRETTGRPSARRLAGAILVGTDGSGVVSRVNSFGEAFFGIFEKDIVGARFPGIALPDNFEFDRRKKRFIDYFLYTPEKNGRAEFETRHASGHPRRVAWTRSAVRDSKGTLVEMLYLGIDVQKTSLRRPGKFRFNETTVCSSNTDHTLLEKYIDNSTVWAWEMGADAAFCYVSPGIEGVLGYSPNELIGLSMDFLLTPTGQSHFCRLIGEPGKAGSRHFKFEDQHRSKNGELSWAEIAGVVFYDENKVFSGARGLNRDISREVAAKEELVRKEQEYRYLFDNTQVALMMINEDGVLLNINQTGAQMYGREPGEMIGRSITEFLPESERRATQCAFLNAYQSAKAQKTNFVEIEQHMVRVDTPDGPPRYLRLVPKAIKVTEGDQMVGLLTTVLDVTESHMIHKELERHQSQLQKLVDDRTEEIRTLQEEMLRDERLTTLGRLTSTVSHEIRNPLGTISSSLYIINERNKDKDPRIGRAVERGFRAIRRCDGIIEEMLDFTRTKGLEKRTIDISSWLNGLLDGVEIPEGVSVVRRIDAGLSAPVDARRFHRCVLNILENSLTAIRDAKGGVIHVSTGMSGERLEIRIRDNGPGIPKQLRKRVFDPLYSTKQNGIGMGLPVCKQVMELHGGSISLRSDSDGGVAVTLRLPVSRQA